MIRRAWAALREFLTDPALLAGAGAILLHQGLTSMLSQLEQGIDNLREETRAATEQLILPERETAGCGCVEVRPQPAQVIPLNGVHAAGADVAAPADGDG